MTASGPRLAAVVVHWRNEAELAALVRAWPEDPRFELVVVDNSASLGDSSPPARVIAVDDNLGFAGGVNRGVVSTSAPWILILNPDARPLDGALEALLEAIDELPEAAGIVPALQSADGTSQCHWQLRPLPSPYELLAQTLFLAGVHGPDTEPERGTPVEQPAAAALAIRRDVLESVGGLDEGFYPAWFEDVDLARRLKAAGHRLLFVPEARFEHALGGSVPELGYGPFLWVYYRNLTRYLSRHHGRSWALAARWTLFAGMKLRLLLLPIRCPQRATSRREAAAGLLDVMRGALSRWQRPRSYARKFAPLREREGGR